MKNKEFKSEAQLQSACNAWLKERGILFYHRERGRSEKNRIRNTLEIDNKKIAYPDLMIFTGSGYCFFIEVKFNKGVLSKEQDNFCSWAKKNKYHFYVCDSWDIFMLIMRLEGIKNEK